MFTKVSVLVPTRHRVGRLMTLLDSFHATEDGRTADLVFRVDEDDRDTQQFLCALGGVSLVVGPRYDGYKSMPRFFNEAAACAKGDVLMCGNDDMVFRTPGWAARILEAANRYPDGLFDFGVSTHNETHYPFSIVSRKAVERLGFLWDARVYWGDIFLRDVMAHFGRAVMLPDVCIDHDWAGFNPDQVFLESEKDVKRIDPNYWTVTHPGLVRAAIERLEATT